MHTYEQSTGRWFHNGQLLGTGYAGNAEGKNNPNKEAVHDVGPLPRGLYKIAPAEHLGEPLLEGWEHGPFILPLIPDASNEMYARAGFLVRGDKIGAPGTASQGCIVQSRPVREQIERLRAAGDDVLEVVAFFVPPTTLSGGS